MNPVNNNVYLKNASSFANWISTKRLMLNEVYVLSGFMIAILISSYALTAVPNVKLMDLLVFVAGYSLGFRRGIVVATGAWLIYGTFNPWGVASPFLLVTLMSSEVVFVAAGCAFRLMFRDASLSLRPNISTLILLGMAVTCTLAYDVVTNIHTGIIWAQMIGSTDYIRWINIAIFNHGAVMFSAIHVASNAVIFVVLGPSLMRFAKKTIADLQLNR